MLRARGGRVVRVVRRGASVERGFGAGVLGGTEGLRVAGVGGLGCTIVPAVVQVSGVGLCSSCFFFLFCVHALTPGSCAFLPSLLFLILYT